MAAFSVAKHLGNKEDIDALVDDQHIPQSVKPLIADFIDNNTTYMEEPIIPCNMKSDDNFKLCCRLL